MGFAEYARSCPMCGLSHAFEWAEREKAGWCIGCGYFQHYHSYTDYLTRPDDDEPVYGG